MARTAWRRGIVAGIGFLLIAVRIPAFAQGTSANQDVLAALLAEVRGLRAAMEQMASAGPRVQLAMGRMQMQEQRLNTATRRLDDARDRRAEAERVVAQLRDRLVEVQSAVEGETDPALRQKLEAEVRMLKEQTGLRTNDVQRFGTEEADAAAAAAVEQGRWNDFNQKLEDLERSLTRR